MSSGNIVPHQNSELFKDDKKNLRIHKIKKVKNVVFECPGLNDKANMTKAIKSGKNVYVLEPFCAYHHRRFRFFPSPLPEYVQIFLNNGTIKIIDADSVDSRTLLISAAEKAVEAIEEVFPYYLKDHKMLIDFTVKVHNSSEALKIFKKNLCDMLGDFFSLNIMFHKIEKMFNREKVLIYPDADIKNYLYLKGIVNDSSLSFYKHKNIFFSRNNSLYYLKEQIVKSIFIKGSLIAQTFGSMLFGYIFSKSKSRPLKKYFYAISIVAPKRQLRNNRRGPDFLIDNDKIKPEQVVYTPVVPLSYDQMETLKSFGSDVVVPPQIGRFFSNWKKWFILLLLSFKSKYILNNNELKVVAHAIFTYFRWQNVIKHTHFSNFITHCDFSIMHISRNILFKQKNIKTWYFTDTSNFGHNFRESDKNWNRHPFWTYMYYDSFVTWYTDLASYFTSHPQSFKEIHIVGCIWSSYLNLITNQREHIGNLIPVEKLKDSFIVAVYPSTYTVKGITSYEEGIRFIEHIHRLVKEIDNLLIIVKEKKAMELHMQLEPELGKKLVELYKEMEKNPRIKVLTNDFDTSLLMAHVNMCISFPFTSTTTEALSVNKNAIWHDPGEYYRKTPYGCNGSVITHGYKELKNKILKIKDMKTEIYQNPIPVDSDVMDPYRDGKAIDRFRDLLTAK